jgi:hypothetical protein
MRRVGFPVIVTLGLVLTATPALAEPTAASVPVPPANPGTIVCTIRDTVAVGMTGLVATSTGYVVIDGKNPAWGQLRVIYLDKSCNRSSGTQAYSGSGAIDPQDVAIDSKGVLWVADIGDSNNPVQPVRELVSLWKVPSRTGSMTHYKFSYPDGAHNAEALLLDGKGAPIFVTKEISAAAGIYTFSGTLTTASTMKLTKVGSFRPQQTGTANKLGSHGQAQNSVTGGAVAPGGGRVALRTLSDAYEWDVSGGDVVAALTTGTPRITPLPNEDQGYGIAYSADGKSFLTVSFSDGESTMLKYTPAKPAATPAATGGTGGTTNTVKKKSGPGALRTWFNKLTLPQLMWYLGGLAAFGLLLVLLGVYGIRRSRRGQPVVTSGRAAAALDDGSGPPAARAAVAAPVAPAYGAPRSNPAPNFYPEYGDDGQVATPPYDPNGQDRYPPEGGDPPRGGSVYGAGGGGGQNSAYDGPAADPYTPDPVYPGEDRRPSPRGRPGYREDPGGYAIYRR